MVTWGRETDVSTSVGQAGGAVIGMLRALIVEEEVKKLMRQKTSYLGIVEVSVTVRYVQSVPGIKSSW